jgi:hypothetical protein
LKELRSYQDLTLVSQPTKRLKKRAGGAGEEKRLLEQISSYLKRGASNFN